MKLDLKDRFLKLSNKIQAFGGQPLEHDSQNIDIAFEFGRK
jgi:hypothetical protein